MLFTPRLSTFKPTLSVTAQLSQPLSLSKHFRTQHLSKHVTTHHGVTFPFSRTLFLNDDRYVLRLLRSSLEFNSCVSFIVFFSKLCPIFCLFYIRAISTVLQNCNIFVVSNIDIYPTIFSRTGPASVPDRWALTGLCVKLARSPLTTCPTTRIHTYLSVNIDIRTTRMELFGKMTLCTPLRNDGAQQPNHGIEVHHD